MVQVNKKAVLHLNLNNLVWNSFALHARLSTLAVEWIVKRGAQAAPLLSISTDILVII